MVNHKEELATFLEMACCIHAPKLTKEYFLMVLKTYELDHEGRTALKDKKIESQND